MPSSGRLRQRIGGFTLVELLVAITILAVVAVLGWRGLDSIVRARIALNGELTQTRGLQLAFAQLQTDCANVAERGVLGNRKVMAMSEDHLTLVRQVLLEGQPMRLQVIDYRVEQGVLMRRESIATRDLLALDRAWQGMLQAQAGVQSEGVALQTGVVSLRLRIWQAGATAWSNELVETAPVTGTARADDLGLEVSLRLQTQTNVLQKVLLLGPA